MSKKSIVSMIIEALIFIVLLIFVWNFYDSRLDSANHNLSAIRGQIEQVELKNGELMAARDSYMIKYNELSEHFDITNKELKEVKQKLGEKIAYISQLESSIKIDTTIIIRDSIIYRDKNEITSIFSYQDDWVSISGQHNIKRDESFTTVNNISIYAPLQVGLTNDYKIWVKSKNPYIEFNSIEGAVVDGSALKPKKKRFGWGVQFGIGAMYDLIDKDIAVGPYAGLGVEINF